MAKVNPSGSDLVYATFLGGSLDERVVAVAVDSGGSLHAAGWTNSSDFPTKNSQHPFYFRTGPSPGGNVFLTKFAPDGRSLVYSTFLGGSYNASANGLALDREGRAILSGFIGGSTTDGSSFPFKNPITSTAPGAFIARLSVTGELQFSTGIAATPGLGIVADSQNNIYFGAFAGASYSIFRISSDLRSLTTITQLSSLLGLSLVQILEGGIPVQTPVIAISATDQLYLLGSASSTMPQLRPMMTLDPGRYGVFLTRMTTSGTPLYSTFLTSALATRSGIAIGPDGAAHIFASTAIPPINPVPLGSSPLYDPFIAKIVDTSDVQLPMISVTFDATAALGSPGLEIAVDGIKFAAPKTLRWAAGTVHNVRVTQTQGSNGLRFLFARWSDGGALSHSIAPTADATYSAFFDTKIAVRTTVQPTGAGTVTVTPPIDSNGYMWLNTEITVRANANSGYSFQRWSGPLAGQP
ncbi:MAG: hypothetical protein HY820_19590, partial [Acidobacteria bacterium]|nr:hypothetical protein [Acidobacteriota bacterium]